MCWGASLGPESQTIGLSGCFCSSALLAFPNVRFKERHAREGLLEFSGRLSCSHSGGLEPRKRGRQQPPSQALRGVPGGFCSMRRPCWAKVSRPILLGACASVSSALPSSGSFLLHSSPSPSCLPLCSSSRHLQPYFTPNISNSSQRLLTTPHNHSRCTSPCAWGRHTAFYTDGQFISAVPN